MPLAWYAQMVLCTVPISLRARRRTHNPPSREGGATCKSFASIDRKTGKPKTANIVLAIAAKLVIIGLQGLPFSPPRSNPHHG